MRSGWESALTFYLRLIAVYGQRNAAPNVSRAFLRRLAKGMTCELTCTSYFY